VKMISFFIPYYLLSVSILFKHYTHWIDKVNKRFFFGAVPNYSQVWKLPIALARRL
jgi:hypothetical protein